MQKKYIYIALAIVLAAIIGFTMFGEGKKAGAPTDNTPVPEAAAAVRAQVASELGVSEGNVTIRSTEEMEWSDACLGLAAEDEFCAQMITPGYEVTVEVNGETHTYRTNEDGSSVRRQN